jgi:hypothetical protein
MRQSTRTAESRTTGRTHRKLMAVIVSGSMLAVFAFAPAAHAADTVTTFSLTAGLLSVTAPEDAALADAATGAASLSGSLGTVQVTDARGSTAGWGATAASTSFTGSGLSVIPNGEVNYASGAATAFTGVVTPVPGNLGLATDMDPAVTAFSGTVAVGNNSVSWAPTLTVDLPANALAGDYSGTITHSVS